MNMQLSDVPTGLVVAIVIVGIAQLALDVIALVDLYRRPADRVAIGNKWVWVAVILLVNLLGAILYLVVGRKPAPVQDAAQPPTPSAARAADIADSLYGRRDDGTGPGDRGAGPR